MTGSGKRKHRQSKAKRKQGPRSLQSRQITDKINLTPVLALKKKDNRKEQSQNQSHSEDKKRPESKHGGRKLHFIFGLGYQVTLFILFVITLMVVGFFLQAHRNALALWFGFLAWIFIGLAITFYIHQHLLTIENEPTTEVASAQPSSSPTVESSPEAPKTLYDLFLEDFPHQLKLRRTSDIIIEGKPVYQIEYRLVLDFDSKTKFLSVYLPSSSYMRAACEYLPRAYRALLDTRPSGIAEMEAHWPGERATELKDLRFSGRIYVYHEDALLASELETLTALYKSKGLDVRFRGDTYTYVRNHPPGPLPKK